MPVPYYKKTPEAILKIEFYPVRRNDAQIYSAKWNSM